MDYLKVLSIDWDYFSDASNMLRLTAFPDGGNESLSSILADFIWASRYADHPELRAVDVDKSALAQLRVLLKAAIGPNTRVCVASSHRHIHRLITRMVRDQQLELYNIDFHSDLFRQNLEEHEVNCGNWLRLLVDDERLAEHSKFFWTARPDSDGADSPLELLPVSNIPKQTFDLVFLCRSDMWSPPHLDSHFIVLTKAMEKQARGNFSLIEGVNINRYTKAMKNTISEQQAVRKRIMREHSERQF